MLRQKESKELNSIKARKKSKLIDIGRQSEIKIHVSWEEGKAGGKRERKSDKTGEVCATEEESFSQMERSSE